MEPVLAEIWFLTTASSQSGDADQYVGLTVALQVQPVGPASWSDHVSRSTGVSREIPGDVPEVEGRCITPLPNRGLRLTGRYIMFTLFSSNSEVLESIHVKDAVA